MAVRTSRGAVYPHGHQSRDAERKASHLSLSEVLLSLSEVLMDPGQPAWLCLCDGIGPQLYLISRLWGVGLSFAFLTCWATSAVACMCGWCLPEGHRVLGGLHSDMTLFLLWALNSPADRQDSHSNLAVVHWMPSTLHHAFAINGVSTWGHVYICCHRV
jgi:hypothetical protein